MCALHAVLRKRGRREEEGRKEGEGTEGEGREGEGMEGEGMEGEGREGEGREKGERKEVEGREKGRRRREKGERREGEGREKGGRREGERGRERGRKCTSIQKPKAYTIKDQPNLSSLIRARQHDVHCKPPLPNVKVRNGLGTCQSERAQVVSKDGQFAEMIR